MRNTLAIFIYIIGVFIGAAIISPIIWMGVFSDAPLLSFLNFLESHDDFHRYYNRCLMLLAISGLWILWRTTRIKSWGELGWVKPSGNGPIIAQGILIGLASVTSIAVLSIIFDAREFRPDAQLATWITHWINTLLAALLVGIIEETIFRGMLFSLLKRDMDWRIAAIISAVIFSSVHFIDQRPSVTEISWTSGFTAFPEFIHDFANDPFWIAHFANLVLAGFILAAVTQRTGSLYCAIGIHAGWIIAIKTNGFLTKPANFDLLWGDNKTIDGWIATPLLTLILWYIIISGDKQSSQKIDALD